MIGRGEQRRLSGPVWWRQLESYARQWSADVAFHELGHRSVPDRQPGTHLGLAVHVGELQTGVAIGKCRGRRAGQPSARHDDPGGRRWTDPRRSQQQGGLLREQVQHVAFGRQEIGQVVCSDPCHEPHVDTAPRVTVHDAQPVREPDRDQRHVARRGAEVQRRGDPSRMGADGGDLVHHALRCARAARRVERQHRAGEVARRRPIRVGDLLGPVQVGDQQRLVDECADLRNNAIQSGIRPLRSDQDRPTVVECCQVPVQRRGHLLVVVINGHLDASDRRPS